MGVVVAELATPVFRTPWRSGRFPENDRISRMRGAPLPFTEDGVRSLTEVDQGMASADRWRGDTPLLANSACKAVTFGDARSGTPSDPKKIIMKLRVECGRASVRPITRKLVDSGRENLHLLRHVVGVLERCEISRVSVFAPHVPINGTSAVSTFNGMLQIDFLSLGDIAAFDVIDVFSKYP